MSSVALDNNRITGPPMRLDVTADIDESPFISLALTNDDEDEEELAEGIITTEAEADALLDAVTRAVDAFKKARALA